MPVVWESWHLAAIREPFSPYSEMRCFIRKIVSVRKDRLKFVQPLSYIQAEKFSGDSEASNYSLIMCEQLAIVFSRKNPSIPLHRIKGPFTVGIQTNLKHPFYLNRNRKFSQFHLRIQLSSAGDGTGSAAWAWR